MGFDDTGDASEVVRHCKKWRMLLKFKRLNDKHFSKCKNIKQPTHLDRLEMDIVSESVRPELKLANSESRRETGA